MDHTRGSHKATLLSAPKASTPDWTSQSAAPGCRFPPTLIYSVVTDAMLARTCASLDVPVVSALDIAVAEKRAVAVAKDNCGIGLIDKNDSAQPLPTAIIDFYLPTVQSRELIAVFEDLRTAGICLSTSYSYV